MRVLVVDDDPVSRLLAQALTRDLGHEVDVAVDGEQAWALLQAQAYDVLLSDREMPGLDGVSLCRRLREQSSATQMVPDVNGSAAYCYVLLVTGRDTDAEALEGLDAGADDYLSKPLQTQELRRRLLVAERVTALHRRLQRQQAVLAGLGQEQHALARRDPLTLLPNRLALQEHLARLEDGARRRNRGFSIGIVDVDHFKSYNDTAGHAAGDDVLRTLAQAMAAQVRLTEGLYRWGGEEFVHVSEAEEPAEALAATDRLCRVVRDLALPHLGRAGCLLTVSAGIATSNGNTPSSTTMEAADAALYRAKQAGRDRSIHARSGELIPLQHTSTEAMPAAAAAPPAAHTGSRRQAALM